MRMFDVCVFPSIFEGLPVTLVEAQAAGVPCVVSKNVTTEVDMGVGLIKFESLNSGVLQWVDDIMQMTKVSVSPESIKDGLKKRGYDVSETLERLLAIYRV